MFLFHEFRYIDAPIAAADEIDEKFEKFDLQHDRDNDDGVDDDNDNTKVPKSSLPVKNNKNLAREKFKKLSEGLCEVLSDFGLVSFLPMNVQDGEVSVCA